MGFLAPLWLGALAAIAIPILLHLRAAAPPERIQVGSIDDLQASLATTSCPRIREWLLLALRVLFVTLLALLLAQPVMRDQRPGRMVAVVPAGAERLGDSLRGASVPIAEAAPTVREPWQLATEAEAQLGVNDTILLVTPDGGDRYHGARPTLSHKVRLLPFADTPPVAPAPLRLQVTASSPQFTAPRDTVARWLASLPATLIQVAAVGERTSRTIVVGRDTALALDSTSLAHGALVRDGALDTLLTRLLPPPAVAPPLAERAPRLRAGDATKDPARDLSMVCWWVMCLVLFVERLVAARRP